jgi:glycosyltransferase involved in cell wall biosynthesis
MFENRTSTTSHLSSKDKRLKVLLFDNDDFSDYTSYFARGISKYVDVNLYCFSKDSPKLTGAANQKEIEIKYISKRLPKGYSSIKGIIRVFFLFFILLHVLLRTKYDIVHIQDYLPTFFLFIPILKLKRKRICWTLHDLDIFSLWDRLFAKGVSGKLQILFRKMVTQPMLMSKFVDIILVHALSHKEQLMIKNVNAKKVHVVRQLDYGYLLEDSNNSSKSSRKLVKDENYILLFGNIAPWKGVDTLIKAARIVKNKKGINFSVVIAGKPYPGFDSMNFFENVADQESKFIKIINKYITSSEIPSLIGRSAFLVLPYDYQFQYSSSGVIPLSYTFEKPVIVSSVPSLVEYVEQDKTGLIFEMNDSKQLADCMIELLENESKCIAMGQNAYQKMVHEMSLDVCCKNVNDLYNNLVK